MTRLTLFLPVLLVIVGLGWLLSALGVMPQIDWLWVLGLAAAGVLALAGGIDRLTLVIGLFFFVCSGLSVLRQMGKLSIEVELPILLLAIGVLSLLVRVLPVRNPKWWELAKQSKS